jgi:hypothetical protein
MDNNYKYYLTSLESIDLQISSDNPNDCDTHSDDLKKKDNIENLNNISTDNIIYYETIPECPSKSLKLSNKDDYISIKVPVVISTFEVEVDISHDILLYEAVSDIMRIKNNVYLDSCKLFPQINKLFISGYIRKSFEYAPWVDVDSPQSVDVKHSVFIIPFKCTTNVEYSTPPKIYVTSEESVEGCYSNTQPFNEKISCDLVGATIIDDNDIKAIEAKEDYPLINGLSGKILLTLILRLVQNQVIEISIYR